MCHVIENESLNWKLFLLYIYIDIHYIGCPSSFLCEFYSFEEVWHVFFYNILITVSRKDPEILLKCIFQNVQCTNILTFLQTSADYKISLIYLIHLTSKFLLINSQPHHYTTLLLLKVSRFDVWRLE